MPARTRTERLSYLLVALLPALVTLPRFWNGFVFDDVFVIARGDFIHDLRNLPRAFTAHTMVASSLDAAVGQPAMDTYRPLSIASFFVDAALSGRAPWAYHLTNTLLHAGVCLLVLRLLRALLPGDGTLPLLLTLCFGLAPWLAEAHVFINGRSDLFLALFVLSALLLQRRALAREAPTWSVLGALATLAALLSKETAVCALPFVVLVPTQAAATWQRRALLALPHAAALLVYMLLRHAALAGLRTHTSARQLGAALSNLPLLLVDGAFHALVPSPFALRNLRDDYVAVSTGLTLALALVLAALVVFVIVTVVRRRQLPAWSWSLTFGLATLAPAAMITTELWPGFGRYLYLPAVGFHGALGCGLRALLDRRPALARAVFFALVLVASAAGASLVDATLALRDEETMYARSLARAPEQAWSIGSLGLARKREGHCDEAIPLLAVAGRMAPEEPRYAVHLARCLFERGQPREAIEEARRGRARFQDTRQEAAFIAIEVMAQPPWPGAAPLLERCLRLNPARADCRQMLQQLRGRAPR